MRPAGTRSHEATRAPGSGVNLRRAAGADQGEALRAPGAVSQEQRRAGGTGIEEALIDPFVRAHPPTLGCTVYSIQAIAGLAVATCMVAGLNLGYRPPG